MKNRWGNVVSFYAERCSATLKYCLLLIIICVSSAIPRNGMTKETANSFFEVKKETIVYITRTGEKYHQSGCRYLSKSKIEISKKEAVKNGYTACKVCKP